MKTRNDVKFKFNKETNSPIWVTLPSGEITCTVDYIDWLEDYVLANGLSTSHDKALHKHVVSKSVCKHNFSASKRWVHCCLLCGELRIGNAQTDCITVGA